MVVWALNDHVFKEAMPGFVTGKLSDVVSPMVFPLLATAVTERVMRRWALPVWLVATGFVMATINTLDVAAEAYEVGLGAAQWPAFALGALVRGDALPALHRVDLTMDPTDLLTLPALIAPWWLWHRVEHAPNAGSAAARVFVDLEHESP